MVTVETLKHRNTCHCFWDSWADYKWLQRNELFIACSSAECGPPAKQHSANHKYHSLSCPELKIQQRKGRERKERWSEKGRYHISFNRNTTQTSVTHGVFGFPSILCLGGHFFRCHQEMLPEAHQQRQVPACVELQVSVQYIVQRVYSQTEM